jgi:rhodanese-related sulfurtransferase
MKHTSAFLSLCEAARQNVKEVSVQDAAQLMKEPDTFLVDVREDREWVTGHAAGAVHLGKGIIERDIEVRCPDHAARLLLYCGGGYRSVLAAESLQKMGYTNVVSVAGGYSAWVEAGLPTEH